MVWKINTQPNHTIHIPSKVHCCNFCDLYLVPNGSMSSSSWSDLQCSTTRRVHDRDGGGPSVSGGWGASCRQNSSRCQPRISTRNEPHVFSNKLYSNLIFPYFSWPVLNNPNKNRAINYSKRTVKCPAGVREQLQCVIHGQIVNFIHMCCNWSQEFCCMIQKNPWLFIHYKRNILKNSNCALSIF